MLWYDLKGCENRLRQIRIIERYRMMFMKFYEHKLKHTAGKWCEVTTWPTCDSKLNTDILLLSHLIACPHCVYSLCWHNFLSTSIRLFSVAHWWKSCRECWYHLSAVDRVLAPAPNSYYKYSQGICDEYTYVFRVLIGWRGCDSQRFQRFRYFRAVIFYK